MGSFDSGRASDLGGINIGARRPDSLNGIRFDSDRDDPTAAGDVILYRGTGSVLKFWDGSSATSLGSAGALVSYTLNDGYDDGRVLVVDNGAVTLNGVAQATAVLSLTGDAATTAPIVLIANSGSGNDITGTSSLWSVAATGIGTFVGLLVGNGAASGEVSSNGAFDLVLQTNSGTNSSKITITDGANGAITCAMNGTGKFVISGTTETNTSFQVTNGDAVISDGSLTITDDDNAAAVTITTTGTTNALTIVADSVTTGNVIDVNADGVTTGALIHLDSSAAGLLGSFIDCYNGAGSVFTVGVDGAVVIAGTAAGTAALTLTLGDLTLSGGAASITQTADGTALTIVADAGTTAVVIDVNADAITSGTLLHLDTSLATFSGKYIDCYDGAATDFSVGADGAVIITSTVATTTPLTITANSATTTTAGLINMDANGLTTGVGIKVDSTSIVMTSGELMQIGLVASGSLATKTGNMGSFSSSMTMTTAGVTEDYDMFLFSRTDIANEAGQTLTSQGSTVKILHTATQTAGTLTDTSIGLEILEVGATGWTGSGLQVTTAAAGAKAINVVSISTTVSDVLITGSGVKADNKAVLEVVGSGATAAGGSILRVTGTGTPAAATSYLVDFDYSGATMTNNPVGIFVNGGGTTASAMQITGSGAIAAGAGTLELVNTNAGAVGAVLILRQTSASPANSDVTGAIEFWGNDSGAGSQQWGKIHSIITDVTAASEDADLIFSVMKAGTLTVALQLDSDLSGVIVGSGAAAGVVQSSGNFDLTMQTGNATSGTITITDGVNGAITVTPNGSGKIDLANVVLMSKTESIGAGTGGAIDVVSSISELATDAGGDAYQLADGAEGQLKFIILKTDGGGDAVITPANPGGYSTITMADAGDSVTLLFTNGKWYVAGFGGVGAGAVIA
jgi:hypothetical protein